MAGRVLLVSPEGDKATLVEYDNRSREEAITEVREAWGADPVEVPDRAALKRAVRTPGPPSDELVDG